MDLKLMFNYSNWLIQNGDNTNEKNYLGGTLTHLMNSNNVNINNWISKNGENVQVTDSNGFTLAHVAVSTGNLEILETCLLKFLDSDMSMCQFDLLPCIPKNDSVIDIRDKNGFTPAHIATIFNQLDIIEYLIQNGTDINIISYDGYTIAHLASLFGYVKIIEWLGEKGADLNAKNKNGWTVSQLAAIAGHLDVIKSLVKYVDIKVKDKENRNLAHLAAIFKNLEVVVWLTENGIQVNEQDNFKRTVYNYLYDKNNR